MDAVTYPKEDVVDQINRLVIPVRIPFDSPLAKEFEVKWTPGLLFLDEGRKEHHRIIGFLPPEELVPAILLGVGKTFFDTKQLDRAIELLNEVVDKHPRSHAAPEAVYFHGVSRYKQTHSGEPPSRPTISFKPNIRKQSGPRGPHPTGCCRPINNMVI